MPKPNTHLRKDRHSLWVRTNGSLFRPVKPLYMVPWSMASLVSAGEPGEPVYVRHLTGTPLVKVEWYGKLDHSKSLVEYWYSHGWYLNEDGTTIPSELVWRGPDE